MIQRAWVWSSFQKIVTQIIIDMIGPLQHKKNYADNADHIRMYEFRIIHSYRLNVTSWTYDMTTATNSLKLFNTSIKQTFSLLDGLLNVMAVWRLMIVVAWRINLDSEIVLNTNWFLIWAEETGCCFIQILFRYWNSFIDSILSQAMSYIRFKIN